MYADQLQKLLMYDPNNISGAANIANKSISDATAAQTTNNQEVNPQPREEQLAGAVPQKDIPWYKVLANKLFGEQLQQGGNAGGNR